MAFSPPVFLFCCLPYQILKRIPFAKKFAEKIPFRHTIRLDCLVADLYDRFSPPIENRYNKEQIKKWFEELPSNDKTIKVYKDYRHILTFEEKAGEVMDDITNWIWMRANAKSIAH